MNTYALVFPAGLILVLLLVLFPLLAAAQGPAAPVRPAKLGLCSACHGVDGTSRTPGTPHLGGQDRLYLERALSDYRSGKRQHVPMTSLANTLQPRDIQALAAWYAAQPGFKKGNAR